MKQFRSKPLMKRIPHLDSNESLAAKEEGQSFTLPAKVRHLSMDELILNQTPDLTVNHPIKLGNQNDIIAEFAMLREEGKPLSPAGALPFPGIENQLTFVNHKQNRSFFRRFGSKTFLAVIDQILWCQLVIRAIGIVCSFVLAEIHREVPDHRVAQA